MTAATAGPGTLPYPPPPGDLDALPESKLDLLVPFADKYRNSKDPAAWHVAVLKAVRKKKLAQTFADENLPDGEFQRAVASAIISDDLKNSGAYGRKANRQNLNKAGKRGRQILAAIGEPDLLGRTTTDNRSAAFEQALTRGLVPQEGRVERTLGWSKRKDYRPNIRQLMSWPLILIGLTLLWCVITLASGFFGSHPLLMWVVFGLLLVLILGMAICWTTARPSHSLIVFLSLMIFALYCMVAGSWIKNDYFKPGEAQSCAQTGKCSPELISDFSDYQQSVQVNIGVCSSVEVNPVCTQFTPNASKYADWKTPFAAEDSKVGTMYYTLCTKYYNLMNAKAMSVAFVPCSKFPDPYAK